MSDKPAKLDIAYVEYQPTEAMRKIVESIEGIKGTYYEVPLNPSVKSTIDKMKSVVEGVLPQNSVTLTLQQLSKAANIFENLRTVATATGSLERIVNDERVRALSEKVPEFISFSGITALSNTLEKATALDAFKPFIGDFEFRDGALNTVGDLLKTLPKEHKSDFGRNFNAIKTSATIVITILKEELESTGSTQSVDTTLPGRAQWVGSYHPLTLVMREITDIFGRMGFRVADGPEIELVKYNFDMLNTPAWHPSRDESDTIYLPNGFVVRTETSPVQVRTMEKQDPPIRIISPGRVYRRDRPDATHSPMFHQCEGLYVDKGVTMAELKGTLLSFYRELFGQQTKLRFRPHFFPFTEPSAEVDVTCPFCKGEGCRICKNTGWLEMGGCGMVDPNVLAGVGYVTEVYTGFAFGLGIDRIAMLRFGIQNIRLLTDSDVRFLRQFSGITPR